MLELDVVEAPAAAALALDPIKTRLLAALSRPASAAALAGRVGLTRQKVNYHLRALGGPQADQAGRRAPMGRPHGTPYDREGIVLCRLARCVRSNRRRSGTQQRPSISQLSHRPGGPHRPRGRRPLGGPPARTTSVSPPFRSTPLSASDRLRIARPSPPISSISSRGWRPAITTRVRRADGRTGSSWRPIPRPAALSPEKDSHAPLRRMKPESAGSRWS